MVLFETYKNKIGCFKFLFSRIKTPRWSSRVFFLLPLPHFAVSSSLTRAVSGAPVGSFVSSVVDPASLGRLSLRAVCTIRHTRLHNRKLYLYASPRPESEQTTILQATDHQLPQTTPPLTHSPAPPHAAILPKKNRSLHFSWFP
jgi:hypothetical protein